tara:strand:- start:229 stop:903 length:675 start_codon:yes stop_codon:yes gene_type:complete
MELKESTLSVLKNYAAINPNIVVQKGNKIKTMTEARNVLSSATLEEEFPQEFGIYDLNEFLGVIGLVGEPRLTFENEYVTITDSSNRSRVKYFFSDPEMLTTPTRDVQTPPIDVSFVLDNDTLNRIKKASSTLGHTEFSITGKDGVLTLAVIDSKNTTSNAFSIDISGEFTEDNFNFIFDIKNLKMIPGDYQVGLSSKLISHFVNKNTGIEYWIALEKTSTFGV